MTAPSDVKGLRALDVEVDRIVSSRKSNQMGATPSPESHVCTFPVKLLFQSVPASHPVVYL